MAGDTYEAQAAPALAGSKQASELERQLQQRDAELAAAWAQLAMMDAEAAGLRARLDRDDLLDGRATSAGSAVE